MNDEMNIQDLRRYVDGEMDAEEATGFERRLERDETLRAAVEFERLLCERIATVMAAPPAAAPTDLRDRVRTALAEAGAGDAVAGRIRPGDEPARTAARRTIFSGPHKANIFAVAATLAVVAGAVLFGIFGRPIDDAMHAPSGSSAVHEAAAFAAREHNRCRGSETKLQTKLIVRDPDRAADMLASHLGVTSVPALDLSSLGYSFVGAGPCGVPHAPASGHMMFQRDEPIGEAYPMVSVFMVPDDGRFTPGPPIPTDAGEWDECARSPDCAHRVLYATNGELMFFICCCIDEDIDEIAEVLGGQMGGS